MNWLDISRTLQAVTKGHRVFILLGSNLGNREEFLKKARNRINKDIGAIEVNSSLYETAAWGIDSNQSFLNQVIEVRSTLPPGALLQTCLHIETDLGRVRRSVTGDRKIDIDILLYSNKIVRQKKCTIPHPRLHLRNFAMVPLQEIAPGIVHPEFGISITELLDLSTDKLKVKKIETPTFTA